MLGHTYLPKPAVTWHIHSLCGGDATRSLGMWRGRSSVTVVLAQPQLEGV